MERALTDLDDRLYRLKYRLEPLHYLNPTNVRQQQRRFFSRFHRGERYDPQFRYPKPPQRTLRRALDTLAAVEIPRDTPAPVRALFRHEIRDTHARAQLIAAIGTSAFTGRSRTVYGVPRRDTLAYARTNAAAMDDLYGANASELVSPRQAQRRLRRALEDRGYRGWRVETNIPGAPTVVYPEQRTLYLKEQPAYSTAVLETLIAHEIDGHAAQDARAAAQPYRILLSGVGRYETLNEGYAVYKEAAVNPLLLQRLSLYYLAVAYAQRHPFYETFCYLTQWLPLEQAFFLAARVKRGLQNTAQPGGLTKDLVYLEGYRAMSGYTAADRQRVADAKFDVRCLRHIRELV